MWILDLHKRTAHNEIYCKIIRICVGSDRIELNAPKILHRDKISKKNNIPIAISHRSFNLLNLSVSQ